MISETLVVARKARLEVLDKMLSVIPESRKDVSKFAPKIELVHIPVEKIGELIGPGGRVIKNIIAETGATIDVEDDGTVAISAVSEEVVTKAVTEFVKNPNDVVKIGQKVKVRVIEVDEQGRINLSMLFGEIGEGQRQSRPGPIEGPRAISQRTTVAPSTHPLALQFRREKAAQINASRGGAPWRKNPRGKPSGSPSTRFRKTHY